MTTVRIKVDANRVKAYQYWTPSDLGDINPAAGASVDWKHVGGTDKAFIVTFDDVVAKTPGSPFLPPHDTQVRVPAGQTIKAVLNPGAVRYWKYKAAVESPTTIKPHDPMIIIRGGKNYMPIVTHALATAGGVLVTLVAVNEFLRPMLCGIH